jgi:hypothetical protein
VVRRRLPPLVAHALLAIGSIGVLALALVGLELLARWWAPGYLAEKRSLHVFSSTYGWTGRPGAVAPMGGGLVSLNTRGYRGRELTLPKAGDRTRVVVLGDSVAFGYGVSDEQTFPHLLDVRDNGLEAGSLAVPGYGLGQELLVLLHDDFRSEPDVVVLAVCQRNDFADTVLPVELYGGVTPRPRFVLTDGRAVLDDTAVRRSRAARAAQWLADYSQLFNRVAAWWPRPAAPEDPGWRSRKQAALSDEDYVLRLSVALVLEMRDACRRRGVRFLVATFPNGLSYDMPPGLATRFRERLAADGVWVVDMGARFRALGLTPGEVAFDRTGHLRPRGHAASAEILEREIASRLGAASPKAD